MTKQTGRNLNKKFNAQTTWYSKVKKGMKTEVQRTTRRSLKRELKQESESAD
jgi:hypothetical protein